MSGKQTVTLTCRQELRDLILAGYFLSSHTTGEPMSSEQAYANYSQGLDLCEEWGRSPTIAMAIFGQHLARHGGHFALVNAEVELAYEDSIFQAQEAVEAICNPAIDNPHTTVTWGFGHN